MFQDYFYNQLHLKYFNSGEHLVVNDKAFWVLYDCYGGVDIPRLSIKASNNKYEVEVCLLKFEVQTFPKVKYIQGISKSQIIFMSR